MLDEIVFMETCIECVKNAKIAVPQGGDAEAVVAMYCAKDKVKRLGYGVEGEKS